MPPDQGTTVGSRGGLGLKLGMSGAGLGPGGKDPELPGLGVKGEGHVAPDREVRLMQELVTAPLLSLSEAPS